MKIICNDFGDTKNGLKVSLFVLENDNNVKICIMDFGAIITNIFVPDKNGNIDDIALGFDSVTKYENDSAYMGAIVGRFANRIANAKFNLEGSEYKLCKNDGKNCLHGGKQGFNKKLWKAETEEKDNGVALHLKHRSPDMDEGFPGNLDLEVIYTLTNKNELVIDYRAVTDKTTLLNLTNHTYFNLLDGGKTSIEDHKIRINADKICPINNSAIPIQDYMFVENTPLDLRKMTKISENINNPHIQLKNGKGFDHNYVINNYDGTLKFAAEVIENSSGRSIKVLTTEPGVQFYSGNHLNMTGKGGIKYSKRHGLCLETQHFPDSPNRPNYPSTVLHPGELFSSQTVYKFGIID